MLDRTLQVSVGHFLLLVRRQ